MPSKIRLMGVLAAALAAGSMPTPTKSDMIHDYNLIVTGTLTVRGGEVEGRAAVGALDVINATNFAFKDPSGYAGAYGLVVGTAVTGTDHNPNEVKVQGGNALLPGNPHDVVGISGGGSITIDQSAGAAILQDAALQMQAYSSFYAGLAANSSVVGPTNGQPGPVNFNVGNNISDGIAVFDIDASLFSSNTSQSYVLNTAAGISTYIINVDGTSVNFNRGNMLAGFNIGGKGNPNVLFNFHQATTITAQQNFYGAILAPLVDVTSLNTQEGSLFVRDLTIEREVHLPQFTGHSIIPIAVPEPPSFLLTALSIPAGAAFALYHRRRARASSVTC
jgi:choice-of-anchor A domain-containing protein